MPNMGAVSFGFALCRGQQAIDIDATLRGYVDTTVGDGRNREAERVAGTIAPGILCGIVEFMRDIGSLEGEENGGLLAAIPNLGGDDPDDGVFGAFRGDGGRAGIVDICGAFGDRLGR